MKTKIIATLSVILIASTVWAAEGGLHGGGGGSLEILTGYAQKMRIERARERWDANKALYVQWQDQRDACRAQFLKSELKQRLLAFLFKGDFSKLDAPASAAIRQMKARGVDKLIASSALISLDHCPSPTVAGQICVENGELPSIAVTKNPFQDPVDFTDRCLAKWSDYSTYVATYLAAAAEAAGVVASEESYLPQIATLYDGFNSIAVVGSGPQFSMWAYESHEKDPAVHIFINSQSAGLFYEADSVNGCDPSLFLNGDALLDSDHGEFHAGKRYEIDTLSEGTIEFDFNSRISFVWSPNTDDRNLSVGCDQGSGLKFRIQDLNGVTVYETMLTNPKDPLPVFRIHYGSYDFSFSSFDSARPDPIFGIQY